MRFLKRMQIMEPNQVNILAFTVPGDLQQIGGAEKTRLSRQLRRDIGQFDLLDRIDLDLAFIHAVPGANLHAGTDPESNAAGNLSATDSFTKALCEHHAESLHPARPNVPVYNPPKAQNHMPTSRRELLLGAAALSAAKAIAQSPPASPNKTMIGVPFESRETVRMGLIGAGGRGGSMIAEFLACENLRVTAICDINPDHARKAAAAVTKRGENDPALYTNGEHDYENLVKRDDVDFVY